jgi:glycosyltransferase involved in cell wall biosynthesis
MKIGFDISTSGATKTGCGYFTYSLLHALADIDSQNEYLLYPTFGDHYWDPHWAKTISKIPRPSFRRGLGHRTHAALQTFWRDLPSDAKKQLGDPDLIHSNNFFCPSSSTLAPIVYTLYDLSFIAYPDHTLEETRVAAFRGVFNASTQAQKIIAISDYTRRHFLEIFPHYPPEQINVIYPASRFSSRSEQFESEPSLRIFEKQPRARPFDVSVRGEKRRSNLSPDSFWLSVGTLEPRKNHERLLKAYAQLKARAQEILPLVLVGVRGWLMKDFEKQIAGLSLQNDVMLLGYVDDLELRWLYQNCFAFLYPSLFEGFGMPVLEAMSLGAAVIASNTTSIPEIVGDAGLLVDPKSDESICHAMKRLLDDSSLRRDLQSLASLRSQKFSWQTSARQVLDVYKSLDKVPRLSRL